MMGSGGMVVVDDATCMVDFAKFFLKFTAEESCGKCVPCRVGTHAHARDPRAHLRRRGHGATTSSCSSSSADDIIEGSLCAARRQRPQPGALHPALLPRRGHGPRRRAALPGQGLPAAHPLHHRRGRLHRLPRLPRGLPHAARSAASASSCTSIDQKLCIKCDTCRQVCKFDAIPVETGILGAGRREAAVSTAHQGCREAHHRRHASSPPARARPSSRSRAARASTSPRCATRRAWPPGAPAACAWSRSRASTSCRPPAPPGSPTAWSSRPTPRASARAARATSRCTSPTTTPTARRRARTPAPRTSTSPPTWRRWPPATPPARPPSCATSCRSPASSGASARATASRSAGAATWTSPSPSAPCTGRPPTTATRCSIAGRADRQAGRRHRRRPGRPRRRLVPHRSAATRSPSTTPTTKPGGSLRYSIPEFRLPEKVVDKELAAAVGGRRALRRRVRARLRGRPRRPVRRRLRRRGHQRRHLGGAASTSSPATTPRCDGLELPQARARGPRRQVHAEGRRDRRRHHRPRRRPARRAARAPRRSSSSPSTRPTTSRPAPASSPPPSKRASSSSSAPWPRRSRPRPARRRASSACASCARRAARKEVRGSRFDVAATTVVMATGYAPELGDSADYLPLADGGGCRPTTTPAARPKRACSPPATPSPAPSRRSTPWPAASARRWPSTPGCAAQDLDGARGAAGRLQRPALPRAAQGRRRSSASSAQRLAERSPVWLKMGASAEPAARATMPKVGKAKRLAGHRRRGREGLQPRRRAAPRPSAACSASAPAWAPATCRSWAWSTASPTTTSSSRAAGCARSSRSTSTRSSAATWSRCIACGALRARLPRRGRPGLLRLHRARLHHQRRHALRRGPAAGRLHHLRPLRHAPAPPARSPSTSAS